MTTSLNDSGVTFADGSVQPSAAAPQIVNISASVVSNALTISTGALSLAFRSTTLGSGTTSTVSGTPSSLVVPTSATLGTVNATQSRLVVIALNNAGTIELAVVNISGGNDLSETGLISTTAISAAATSASVVYSTTARTSVAYRVIGYVESTQATAGTWATAPSTIQGYGGQALAAMSSLGYGQAWQDVAASRVLSTTYYNLSGKPILISIVSTTSAVGTYGTLTVAGSIVNQGNVYGPGGAGSGATFTSQAIVPAGSSYSFAQGGTGSLTINYWKELR